jgi:hypothetical protein
LRRLLFKRPQAGNWGINIIRKENREREAKALDGIIHGGCEYQERKAETPQSVKSKTQHQP